MKQNRIWIGEIAIFSAVLVMIYSLPEQ
jgi:hypothetical protein